MKRMCKRVFSIFILLAVFMLGFLAGGYAIGGAMPVQAVERDDKAATESMSADATDTSAGNETARTASNANAAVRHPIPIMIRGGSLTIEFPSDFKLKSGNNTSYLYEEPDKNAQISDIVVTHHGKVIFEVHKTSNYIIKVEYEHPKR